MLLLLFSNICLPPQTLQHNPDLYGQAELWQKKLIVLTPQLATQHDPGLITFTSDIFLITSLLMGHKNAELEG
jgi:hypothetical protein